MPQKTCKNCGSSFYCKPSHESRRKFCSKLCQCENKTKENTELRKCKNCEKEYSIVKSRERHNRGSVCSKKCQYDLAKKLASDKAKIKTCLNCKKEFKVTESSKTQRYCCAECRYTHMIGENNPLFLHGDGGNKRGPYWQKIKRAIRKRDNYTCQHCGIKETELKNNVFLHVHHIIPYRNFESHEEANKNSNLITLCPCCHRKADAEIRKKELTKKSKDVKVESVVSSTTEDNSLANLFQD